jgi:hypothetical protein
MPRKETRPGPHHFSAPDLQTGGKLPRGYWKCPENGCNVEHH